MVTMGFRLFDILFAVVLVLAAVAVAAAFYLISPYPAVIVAAFAAGATTFLYLTVRAKLGGILETLERRLATQESEAAEHRAALDKSFAEIERLTRSIREQVEAANEKGVQNNEALRKNVNDALAQFAAQIEKSSAAVDETKQVLNKKAAVLHERVRELEHFRDATTKMLADFREEFDAYTTDEQHFREVMEASLAERVSYLEDFIREKRKSLQI
jgi:flagellar biosynthesis chaperone FliJ